MCEILIKEKSKNFKLAKESADERRGGEVGTFCIYSHISASHHFNRNRYRYAKLPRVIEKEPLEFVVLVQIVPKRSGGNVAKSRN